VRERHTRGERDRNGALKPSCKRRAKCEYNLPCSTASPGHLTLGPEGVDHCILTSNQGSHSGVVLLTARNRKPGAYQDTGNAYIDMFALRSIQFPGPPTFFGGLSTGVVRKAGLESLCAVRDAVRYSSQDYRPYRVICPFCFAVAISHRNTLHWPAPH